MLHLLFNRFSAISSWEDSATLPSSVAGRIGHDGLRESFSVKRARHI